MTTPRCHGLHGAALALSLAGLTLAALAAPAAQA